MPLLERVGFSFLGLGLGLGFGFGLLVVGLLGCWGKQSGPPLSKERRAE